MMLSILLPTINSRITQLGGSSLSIVLNKVQFGADGNIVADYAGWPEGLDPMEAAGYPPRPDEEYTTSPANLATYYFADQETMFVVPNIDQIIYTVEQNMAKQNRSLLDPGMQEFLQKLYLTERHAGTRRAFLLLCCDFSYKYGIISNIM